MTDNKEKLLLLLEYFGFFLLLSVRVTSGTGCFRNMAGSRGKALEKPCRVRLFRLFMFSVWVVKTQYPKSLIPLTGLFFLWHNFFCCHPFLVTRFVSVFIKTFFF